METEKSDFSWHVVSRWQEYEGESRANLLRAIALAVFYCVELITYYGINLGPLHIAKLEGLTYNYHLSITLLTVFWAAASMGSVLALRNRYFPSWLKYATTAADVLALTMVLLIADGPKSPLLFGYALIVAVAGLRFSLPLVWFTTAATLAGYLVLIGNAYWYRSQFRVPKHYEIIFIVTIIFLGILVGQIIRRVRGLAREFAERMAADKVVNA